MKLFQIFFVFFPFVNICFSFQNLFHLEKKTISINKNTLLIDVNKKNKLITLNNNINNNNHHNNIIFTYKEKTKNKIQSLLKLIRYKNIFPSFLLSFSGGWIMNPSIQYLICSVPFIISIIDTIFIMSASMILNDIYDIEIDKINTPERPLANGEIKITEAVLFSLLLIGISECLTIKYLPNNLNWIIQIIIIQIIIYTPILKKIIIIKNISCASLVSFSLFFSGLTVSSSSNDLMSTNKNFGLLSVAMSLIFFGSWSNEILLDIRDKEGDQVNKIVTVPTLFGNKFSWELAKFILSYNILSNTLIMNYLYNDTLLPCFIFIFLSPLLVNLQKIKKDKYSKKSIIQYMKYSNYPLFLLLLYLCFVARFY